MSFSLKLSHLQSISAIKIKYINLVTWWHSVVMMLLVLWVPGLLPVHWAAVGGHVPVLMVMWDAGMNIKAKTEDGSTPLHLAADHGNVDAVEWLVEKGAYLHVKNKSGSTPRDVATQAGHKGIAKYLKEKEDEVSDIRAYFHDPFGTDIQVRYDFSNH